MPRESKAKAKPKSHSEKRFKCETCGKMCEPCKKSCRFSHCLKKHINKHTEDNPHTCNTCKKSFCSLQSLKQHRIHTAAKPYIGAKHVVKHLDISDFGKFMSYPMVKRGQQSSFSRNCSQRHGISLSFKINKLNYNSVVTE